MSIVTVTVTYTCSLDTEGLDELLDLGGGYLAGKSDDEIVAQVKRFPHWLFSHEFSDDDFPKIEVS